MKNVPMRILDGWARHKRRSHKEKVRFVGEQPQKEEEYSEAYYNQEEEEEVGSSNNNDDYIDAVFE